jgi:lathosterol oxidase
MENQVWKEIKHAIEAMPLMALLTACFFLLDVRGYCKMYEFTADGPGLWYDILQVPLFILFTDFGIYWIHRGLHHPLVYKRFHKPHHKWIIPTPYASYAFHPLDGFSQSVPYHLYPLLFPLNKFIFLSMFITVNVWTVSIHDGEFLANNPLVNGSACHAAHHLYFK